MKLGDYGHESGITARSKILHQATRANLSEREYTSRRARDATGTESRGG